MRANCSKRSKFFAIAERTCRCNVRDSGKIFFRNPWREKEEKRGEFVTFFLSFFFLSVERYFERRIYFRNSLKEGWSM